MAAMTAPHQRPLAAAEVAELNRLLELRQAYRKSIPDLHLLILRAYDSGQVTQVDLAEKGGWRHRDALRQLLNRLRKAAVTGAPFPEED